MTKQRKGVRRASFPRPNRTGNGNILNLLGNLKYLKGAILTIEGDEKNMIVCKRFSTGKRKSSSMKQVYEEAGKGKKGLPVPLPESSKSRCLISWHGGYQY